MRAMLENVCPSCCLAGKGLQERETFSIHPSKLLLREVVPDRFLPCSLAICRADMAPLLQVEQMVRKTVAGLPLASKPPEKKAAAAMPAWNIHSASTKVGQACARNLKDLQPQMDSCSPPTLTCLQWVLWCSPAAQAFFQGAQGYVAFFRRKAALCRRLAEGIEHRRRRWRIRGRAAGTPYRASAPSAASAWHPMQRIAWGLRSSLSQT